MRGTGMTITVSQDQAYIEHGDGEGIHAQVLGRATGADGRERVWLDRRVHRTMDDGTEEWAMTGAISTVLVARG